jgi:hypothetical protein
MQRAGWLALSALGLMALLSLYALPLHAAEEVTVDEGGTLEDVDVGNGMPASNALVRPILAAHPGQLVVVCVAGCPSKVRAVQVLPRPVTARAGGFVPTAAKMGNEAYGPPPPAKLRGQTANLNNDVICVAGCAGRPGQVVQRITGLPSPQTVKAPKGRSGGDKGDGLLDLIP